MQESCHIALDYIKANMDIFEIDSKLLEKNEYVNYLIKKNDLTLKYNYFKKNSSD